MAFEDQLRELRLNAAEALGAAITYGVQLNGPEHVKVVYPASRIAELVVPKYEALAQMILDLP